MPTSVRWWQSLSIFVAERCRQPVQAIVETFTFNRARFEDSPLQANPQTQHYGMTYLLTSTTNLAGRAWDV